MQGLEYIIYKQTKIHRLVLGLVVGLTKSTQANWVLLVLFDPIKLNL